MATLWCPMSRPIASLFLATLPAIVLSTVAAEETSPQPPMRLPGWIESFQRDDQPTTADTDRETPVDGVVTAAGRTPADRTARAVADWSDPKPPSPAAQAIVPTAGERVPSTTPATPAGSFRRWVSERVASLPNPLAPATDASAAAERAEPAPTATEEPAAPTVNAPVAAKAAPK